MWISHFWKWKSKCLNSIWCEEQMYKSKCLSSNPVASNCLSSKCRKAFVKEHLSLCPILLQIVRHQLLGLMLFDICYPDIWLWQIATSYKCSSRLLPLGQVLLDICIFICSICSSFFCFSDICYPKAQINKLNKSNLTLSNQTQPNPTQPNPS